MIRNASMSNGTVRLILLAGMMATLGACAGSEAEVQRLRTPESIASGTAVPAWRLEEVRQATKRFRDVNVALKEGYIRDPMNVCDEAALMGRPASLGVMGVHYFRPDLLGITGPPNPKVGGTGTHTDFKQPAILIYEPQVDGSVALVAVENLVFIKTWEAAGNRERPSFHGVPYNRMEDDPATSLDEAHMFEPHYDLHVWLYRDNPRGIFEQFNPNATCEHHASGSEHGH